MAGGAVLDVQRDPDVWCAGGGLVDTRPHERSDIDENGPSLRLGAGEPEQVVDESEQLFFSHVVNEKFKGYFSINTPMEFDTGNKRIMIKSSWVPFHDKPLLFQFLLLLHATGDFVGKESIARDLWPHEDYKPRVHDPRIFDIAKRARNLIESYEHQPVVLLSGRMGYKLAST